MNLTIGLLKKQLNIESDWTGDDTILQQYLDVATIATQNYLGVNALTGYTNSTIPITIEQAVIMLAGHFYSNRNIVSFAQGTEIPYTYQYLLNYYKDWVVG